MHPHVFMNATHMNAKHAPHVCLPHSSVQAHAASLLQLLWPPAVCTVLPLHHRGPLSQVSLMLPVGVALRNHLISKITLQPECSCLLPNL